MRAARSISAYLISCDGEAHVVFWIGAKREELHPLELILHDEVGRRVCISGVVADADFVARSILARVGVDDQLAYLEDCS